MGPLTLARARECRHARAALLLAVCAALLACRSTSADVEKQAPLASESERLQFALPADFVPLELRGEGSELLKAPSGATARAAIPMEGQPATGRVDVEAGAEFALEVELQPQPAQLPAVADGARRVVQESDLAVFESGGGYWFVMLRELVPEWDESARRSVSCSSAGATRKRSGSELRRFPRAAVERMVAACRSLTLPRLD
ncbi:MAG: hypothetical protein RL033_5924 [Pseudomonadota bacterium]|jgi:hypothetical protein